MSVLALCILLASPAFAQSAPMSPVGGNPSLTLTLDDGSVLTGAVLAVNADMYLLNIDGQVTPVSRSRVVSVVAAAPVAPVAPVSPVPEADPSTGAVIPEVGSAAPTPIPEPSPMAEPPSGPPPHWEGGRGAVIIGSAAATTGIVAHLLNGPADDAQFWTNPVTAFAVATEFGGATAVLAGAGAQRRALRRSGERVNAVALVTGWACYGVGTAWLVGASVSGSEPEIVNPGSALVGAGLALGIVQARVNARVATW